MNTPILFIVFNREDTTAKVFDAIRLARPTRLYVVADGPRSGRPDDLVQCAAVRRTATAVDWPCEVHTLFREHNLGCRRGVAEGIDWFFSKEPEGIVLEDDVLPTPGFFSFCEELLSLYRDDDRVFTISGSNMIGDVYKPPHNYFFSCYNHIWGWASWRRAWRHYEHNLDTFPAWDEAGGLLQALEGDRCAAAYYRNIFNRLRRGELDTWDYQLTAIGWMRGALSALPDRNLTTNLGFGDSRATHTQKGPPQCVQRNPVRDFAAPLKHPLDVERDRVAERLIRHRVTRLTPLRCFRRSLKHVACRVFGGD